MNNQKKNQTRSKDDDSVFIDQVAYWLALLLVLIGLINITPAIPGWDDLWKNLTGNDFFKIRRYPTEWFYPITFFWMMMIVALKQSMWRSWIKKNPIIRGLGLLFDIALLIAAAAIALTYLIEIEAICLIDVFTGDRERLVAIALQAEI